MRRVVTALASVAVAALLASCVVPLPRGTTTVERPAVDADDVRPILDRYQKVRAVAAELLDPRPLATVERGAVLAIDSGTFEVAQRSARDRDPPALAPALEAVHVPRFGAYPLWFVAVVEDESAGVRRVQVFERASAAAPWLLAASPETLGDTELPALRHDGDSVLAVNPGNRTDLALSPTEAASAYAEALDDPRSDAADVVAEDGFITQMREVADSHAALDGVSFTQAWTADDVEFALRADDGGTLVFATLQRRDTYEVEDAFAVGWPEDSPQQAFLAGGISSSGELLYQHQLLLHVPGGGGAPRAVGHVGGFVSAEGA